MKLKEFYTYCATTWAGHTGQVLSHPTAHGLQPGVWYCVDADEWMSKSFGAHTLAGVFGCSPDDPKPLVEALESNGLLLGSGAATRAASLMAT